MKKFLEWLRENVFHLMTAVAVLFFAALLVVAVKDSNERESEFSRACRDIGGAPVHDGRQMACIK